MALRVLVKWTSLLAWIVLIAPGAAWAEEDARLVIHEQPFSSEMVEAGQLLYDRLVKPAQDFLESQFGDQGLFLYPAKPRNEYRRFLKRFADEKTPQGKLKLARAQLDYLCYRFRVRQCTGEDEWPIKVFEQLVDPNIGQIYGKAFVESLHYWPKELWGFSIDKGTSQRELEKMLDESFGYDVLGYNEVSYEGSDLKGTILVRSTLLPSELGHKMGRTKLKDALAHNKGGCNLVLDLSEAARIEIGGYPLLVALSELELIYEQLRMVDRDSPTEIATALFEIHGEITIHRPFLLSLMLFVDPSDPQESQIIRGVAKLFEKEAAADYIDALLNRTRLARLGFGLTVLREHFAGQVGNDPIVREAVKQVLPLHRVYALETLLKGISEDEWLDRLYDTGVEVSAEREGFLRNFEINARQVIGDMEAAEIETLIQGG